MTLQKAQRAIQTFLGTLGYEEGAIEPRPHQPGPLGWTFDYTTPMGTRFCFVVDNDGGVTVAAVRDMGVYGNVPLVETQL